MLRYGYLDGNNRYYAPGGVQNALVKNADGSWTETQPDGLALNYNTSGLLATLQNPAGAIWTIAHDTGNKITYDAGGSLLATQTPLGYRTTNVYTSMELLRAVAAADGSRVTYGYDARNNRVSEANQLGQVTSSVFDSANRRVASVSPLGERTTFGFDAAGRQVRVQNRNRPRQPFLTPGVSCEGSGQFPTFCNGVRGWHVRQIQ